MLNSCISYKSGSIFAAMSKRFIIIIIVLISVALVGLVIIQVYWIKNAITVKEAAFVRTVDDAVSSVAMQLDKEEMTYQLKLQNDFRNQGQHMLRAIDSINQDYYNQLRSVQNFEDYQNLINRSLMAQGVIQEMLNPPRPRPLDKRISSFLLDSLLRLEFDRKGIKTEYEFGVYIPNENRMLFQKTGQYPAELLNEGFVFSLYPNDLQINNAYLIVYFPREKQYIISQLWVLLLTSVVLIFIIIFAFSVSINTIFRQKKLSEMKNDFINNITHEFKTPISTISLACEALSDQDVQKSEEIYKSYINVINEENKRLGTMAEKVLQSALIEKGQLNLKREWINIHEIVNDVVRKIGLQIQKRNGKILTELQAETCVIYADKVHLTNVIFNLLDNASKYTPHDPEILVSTSNKNSSIAITVLDNGIGISKAEQEKIFEKLYRIPTGNIHNFKGFGLGLSYVKAIVEKHGGYVELESEIKKGSKFSVYLPLEEINTKDI